MKQSHKTLLLWVLLIVMFLAIWQFLTPAERKAARRLQRVRQRGPRRARSTRSSIKDREYTFRVTRRRPDEGRRHRRRPSAPSPDEKLLETLQARRRRTRPRRRSSSRRTTSRRSGRARSSRSCRWLFLAPDVLPLHAAAPGGRRQGDELRQVARRACSATRRTRSRSPTSPASTRPRTRSKRSSPSSRTRRSSSASAAASPRASS